MSEYDNLNLDNLNYIYNYLNEFIVKLFECNGKTFELCQRLLLSKEYRAGCQTLLTELYKDNEIVIDRSHFRTFGLLPLIIYHPCAFYTYFNYDKYVQWLKNSDSGDNDSDINEYKIIFYKLYKSSFALKKGLQKLKIMLSPESIYDNEVKTDEVFEIRKLSLDYFRRFHTWKKQMNNQKLKS